ncbi:hypothetical protein HZS_5616 [Henneguya salminicola]|nr:hypothetical protein HZS_5616 [Henneguya salminicola]
MCDCKSLNFGKYCQYKYRCQNCKRNACIRNNRCMSCTSGWEGENCKNRIIKRYNMCLNNGAIRINKKKLKCDCEPNFFGKYCEINCSYICPNGSCSMKAIIFKIYISMSLFNMCKRIRVWKYKRSRVYFFSHNTLNALPQTINAKKFEY